MTVTQTKRGRKKKTQRMSTTSLKVGAMYRHKATGNCYKIITIARNHEDANKWNVVYEQQAASILKNTETVLPVGTTWTRPMEDFAAKFEQLSLTR